MNEFEHIHRAIGDGDIARANRLIIDRLRKATQTGDDATLALCHQLLGNAAEIERRVGDALRNWHKALWHYGRAGITCNAETERVRHLISAWMKHQTVFVSYARADEKVVQQVLDGVRDSDLEFEIDQEFLAGRSIEGQIRSAIERCPKFLAFFSEEYARRSWTQFELDLYREKIARDGEAHAANCAVIFCCLPGWHAATRLIEEFQSAVIIDLSMGLAEARTKLLRSIKAPVLQA